MRTIIEKSPDRVAVYDVFSALVKDRIVFIDDDITDVLANEVIAQLLYLDSISNEPISVYINSYGGEVSQGFAIYDTSKILKSPIKTVCIGVAASMAAMLMLMGTERIGMKHSRIMFHEISGWFGGKFKDMRVYFEQATEMQKEIYDVIESVTTIKNVEELFKVDTWYTSKKALECGILTKIA